LVIGERPRLPRLLVERTTAGIDYEVKRMVGADKGQPGLAR
jgi:hypothetical protein